MIYYKTIPKPCTIHGTITPALGDSGIFLIAERTTYAASILGLNSSCQLPIALKWQLFENFGIEFAKKVGGVILYRKSY